MGEGRGGEGGRSTKRDLVEAAREVGRRTARRRRPFPLDPLHFGRRACLAGPDDPFASEQQQQHGTAAGPPSVCLLTPPSPAQRLAIQKWTRCVPPFIGLTPLC